MSALFRRSLMRTPVEGARISSTFGMRDHPVLGFTRMHKGTDFATPVGTPVFASGDGKITFMGLHGGHGNYVQIRAAGNMGTGYAHMSRMLVRQGTRVSAGQVIGYVGSTGLSTGPHLHFEVFVNNVAVNPASGSTAMR